MKPKLQYKTFRVTALKLGPDGPPEPVETKHLSQAEMERIVERIRGRERKSRPLQIATFDA